MFSWTDYFENNKELKEKDDVKILKKSDLCQMINGTMYSSRACDDKRRICHQKINTIKSHVSKQSKPDHKQNSMNNKQCSKILDLSPEEKAKIAALIRELGVLQSEKEKVSHELLEERNQFQLKLTSMEKMYQMTLDDKIRLEDELRKKSDALRNIEMEERRQVKLEPKLVESKTPYIHVHETVLKTIDPCRSNTSEREAYSLGPPKSSRSHKLKSDLLRSHSSLSVERTQHPNRQSLMEEQKNLVIEKQYLSLVLKQQKCLKKLTNKIAHLERNSMKSDIVTTAPIESNSENSSVITNSVDLVTPRALNNVSLDGDSLDRSISLPSSSRSPSIKTSDSPTRLLCHHNAPTLDSSLLKNDDLLIITALNQPIKDVQPNMTLSSSRPILSLTSTRVHSPTDSLFQIIDCMDERPFPNCSDIESDCSPFRATYDDDILNDLFFTM